MIRERQVSPVEVVEAFLRRIEDRNPHLNAVATLAPDALDQARAAERALLRGDALGPLHGLPVTIKDTIETANLATTAGSKRLLRNIPLEDAPAVARLRAAGAIILGKTNVPELAMTYESDNTIFGRTLNPHSAGRTPGGSSGGEASAIAANMSAAGLGSDLSGSIRIPANFCGIFGLKPTTGLVPGGGHIPPSTGALSQGAVIGPMSRCVEDLRLLLHAIVDEERFDATPVHGSPQNWRVCWYTDDRITPVSDEVKGAVQTVVSALEQAGASVVEQLPPGIERGTELWSKLFARAAAGYAAKLYRGHEGDAGDFVRFIIQSYSAETRPFDDVDPLEQIVRDQLRDRILAFLQDFSFIVAPVGSVHSFPHGTRKITLGQKSFSVFQAFGYSQVCNVFGLPSLAVPAGRTRDRLPLGVQLIGRPFSEKLLLEAGGVIERELGGWVRPD